MPVTRVPIQPPVRLEEAQSAVAGQPGQRTAPAELKQRWHTLQQVALGPSRISDIAHAALVLNGIRK
ncbi:hypothetical protein ACFRFL_29800 [Streptomyces sp. NPDC056708]|uniref:hypothetical protein n=1 Tax=unclassified Streptomyces TaxID=2593676 RepID=UPI0036ABDE3F